MADAIKVLIADDHAIFRLGLKQILNGAPSIVVVDEAGDGEAAWQKLRATAAHVAILDVHMPGRDGFELARAVHEARLAVAIVFLTMHNDEHFLHQALDLEVKGYVVKDSALTEIVPCVRAVAAGREYVSPQLTGFLINRGRRNTPQGHRAARLRDLTAIERRVLEQVAAYKSNREIAEQLCLSVRTIEHHRARITQKLQLEGHHALLKFALEHRAEW